MKLSVKLKSPMMLCSVSPRELRRGESDKKYDPVQKILAPPKHSSRESFVAILSYHDGSGIFKSYANIKVYKITEGRY